MNDLLTVCNDYASVMASINHGRPLRQEAPRSTALADVNKVVTTLLGTNEVHGPRHPKGPANRAGGIGKLFRRFGLKN